MRLRRNKIDVSPDVDKEDIHIIYSDMEDGVIEAALINWIERTEKYTLESFIQYVRSKNAYRIYTEAEFKKLKTTKK